MLLVVEGQTRTPDLLQIGEQGIGVDQGAGREAGEASGGEATRLFVGVGILGGFTTFSSFSMEFWLLFERGQAGQAAAYVLASVVGGILTCGLGMLLIRQLPA